MSGGLSGGRANPQHLTTPVDPGLEVARALMTEPTLIMLDEPMAGVNPALAQSLMHHISLLAMEGMSVVFIEHDMNVVAGISDWVVVLAEGRVIAEGPPWNVIHNDAVIDAYLGRGRQSASPANGEGSS